MREVIRTGVIGQTVETEDSMEIIGLDKAIETIIFEGTLEDMEEKIVEENVEMIVVLFSTVFWWDVSLVMTFVVFSNLCNTLLLIHIIWYSNV